MKTLITTLTSAGGMLKLLSLVKKIVIITTGVFILAQTVGIIKAFKN